MEEMTNSVLDSLRQIDAIIAAIVVATPLILQWVQRVKAHALEARKRYEEGLMELVPWVVRKGHRLFAMYKAWNGYSHPEKKEELRDLIVSAHRRRGGEASIPKEDIDRVLHWAETFWKDNKQTMKEELGREQPVVAAVLDAISREDAPKDPPPSVPSDAVREAVSSAFSESLKGHGDQGNG